MRILNTITRTLLAVGAVVALSLPTLAQDAFNSAADTGKQISNIGNFTGAQTQAGGSTVAPQLQCVCNATIGPQGAGATISQGVNTVGTVRVNALAGREALLNIIANGLEILGVAWGGQTIIWAFMNMAAGTQDSMNRIIWGSAGVTGGLAAPGFINWLVVSCRDANLFS